jgi:hypothetical protein
LKYFLQEEEAAENQDKSDLVESGWEDSEFPPLENVQFSETGFMNNLN